MRLAVAQLDAARSAPGTSTAAERACRAIERAAREHGADVVVLPEYTSGWSDPLTAELAEAEDGPFLTGVRACAAACGVAVVVGVVLTTAEPGRARNVTLVIGADGAVLGRYGKVHLYDAYGTRESDVLDAGDPSADGAPLVVAVPTPSGTLTLGVITCYDLRFPESFRALLEVAVPDVVAVGAAWAAGEGKAEQLRVLARARAIENTVHVALASQSGPGRVGGSAVIDPRGVVLAEVDDDTPAGGTSGGFTLAVADVDPAHLAAVRAVSPVLRHRRYGVHPLG